MNASKWRSKFYQRDSLQVEQVIVYWSTIANKETVKAGEGGNHGNFAGTKPFDWNINRGE